MSKKYDSTIKKFWRSKNKMYFKPLTLREFQIFLGLLLAATFRPETGINLWREKKGDYSFNTPANFGMYMSYTRFNKIRTFFSTCFSDEGFKELDEWWHIIGGINMFNERRKEIFQHVPVVCLDELMSAWRPRTTRTGGLPHLTKMDRKPEPLGTELKAAACSTTGCLLHLEIQRGKEGMALQEFNPKYGGCTGYVLRTLEHINNHEQFYKIFPGKNSQESTFGPMRSAEYKVQCENSDKQIILGDAYFSSVKTAVSTMTLYGRHYVGVVKNCHSKFPKKFLTETLSEAPAGSHMLLSTKHDGVYICALGYKYVKSRKPIMLVFTRGAGTSFSENTPYFVRKNDSYGNVYEKAVERPQIADKYFKACNTIDVHNNKRQYKLQLEKKWLTTDPWFRLSTTLIGLHVVDAYSLYLYHHRVEKQRKQHLQLLEYVEILAAQLVTGNENSLDDTEDFDHFFDLIGSRSDNEESPASKFSVEKKNCVNDFGRHYYVADGVNHRLIKNEKKIGKKGKKYHTTRNCFVCKRSNLRKQTTYHCSACNVPLCFPQLAERTKALKDCFLRYHEARHVEREFKLCTEVDESSEANENVDDMISSDDNNSCAYVEI